MQDLRAWLGNPSLQRAERSREFEAPGAQPGITSSAAESSRCDQVKRILIVLNKRPNQDFERQMLPHLDAAYNLARWLMRHGEDAEDAVQDAFLRAYQAYSSYQGGSEKAWLMTIVRNVCLTRLKRRVQPGKVVMLDEAMGEVEQPSADIVPASLSSRPDTELLAKIERARVQAALKKLPQNMREVVVLREFEDLSYQEISEVVGIPVGTVMSRLSRAREQLKALLIENEVGGRHHEL
jgi:RNA polymerase sigma-70 factor, ECF subfamily